MSDAERLAAYDRMYADLLKEREKVLSDMERLRAAGKNRPVRDLRHQRELRKYPIGIPMGYFFETGNDSAHRDVFKVKALFKTKKGGIA